MVIEPPGIVDRINSFLPTGIRVFGESMRFAHFLDVVRTLNGFHAKNAVDYRIYEYVLPTSAFAGILEKDFKFTKEILTKVNSLLSVYEGTHNYHNFTVGKPAKDPSAYRYMHTIQVF
jgi:tRNA pseudouridine38-40 synthase